MSEYRDNPEFQPSSSSSSSRTLSVLLEAKPDDCWCPIRVIRVSNVRAILDSLPVFARQQKVSCDRVRVTALRSEDKLLAAENAVIAHRRGLLDDIER